MAKSSAKVDPLIGATVRLNPHLTGVNNSLHEFAGQEGTVLTKNTSGTYQVQIGDWVCTVHISDLIPIAGPTEGNGKTELIDAETDLICPSPTNPRKTKGLDIDSISALAASIKMLGQSQAILLRPLPAHRLADTAHLIPRPVYEIVAGERRWRACELAGITVTAIVREMSDAAALEMQLVENIEREDLDPLEEADGFDALRTRLGYTVEQIAERIARGKGESYVYKALKLCELSPQAREAMTPVDGQPAVLSRSTALLVARYRPEQQAEVVAYIKSLAQQGQPEAFRKVAPAVFKRFNLALATAVFDTEDSTLMPDAGACTTCPKRSGAQKDIFGDVSTEPDHCTDADCFADKRTAHALAVHVKATDEGFTVIDGEQALQAKPSPHSRHIVGFVRLSDVAFSRMCDDQVERDVTFEDALRSLGKKAPKPQVFIDPHTGESAKVITDALADKLMPPDDPTPAKAGSAKTAVVDNTTPEIKALRDNRVRRALLIRAFDAIRGNQRTLLETQLIARYLYTGRREDTEAMTLASEDYLGWQPDLEDQDYNDAQRIVAEKVAAMPPEQLGQAIAMAIVEIAVSSWDLGTEEEAVALIESYGIDVLAVRDKVADDLARQSNSTAEEPVHA